MCYSRKRGKYFWFKVALFAPLAIAAIVFIFGNIVMLLWNAVLPSVFAIGTITFWQAIGILVLSKILFGGLGGHGRSHRDKYKRSKWSHLSPEEKEKMKAAWISRNQPKVETE